MKGLTSTVQNLVPVEVKKCKFGDFLPKRVTLSKARQEGSEGGA